ncbi:hypothetical protein BD560DRAFT_426326 [Blakeslea trispora]|nr:hypothetical protein BD560DRAFT_426326 [Blakeslea trispora]
MNNTALNTTRWWWRKSPNSNKSGHIPEKTTPNPSINGADENASLFSLYSYGDSLAAPSYPLSSSIKAHRAKSEYSANHSTDVESTASIRSKPWISKNIASLEDDQSSNYDQNERDSTAFIHDSVSSSSSSIPNIVCIDSSSANIIDGASARQGHHKETSPSLQETKKGTFVGYIVNKPLHGKLKVGLGKLVGSKSYSNNNQKVEKSISRRKSVS